MLNLIIKAALQAGHEIMKIYDQPNKTWQVERKADNSPLTLADRRSHAVIAEALAATPYPVLSEEGSMQSYAERSQWQVFWLVDPLDGTKEFLKRNGEFTVNIALIEHNRPVMGVVYAPALNQLYYGTDNGGAFFAEVSARMDFPETPRQLPLTKREDGEPWRIVASRSHLSPETETYIERMRCTHGEINLVNAGSSLKLCLVAAGKADVYPRLAPTMEWDTGAGDAICRAAGCSVVNTDTGQPLTYNKEDLHNPYFIVQRN